MPTEAHQYESTGPATLASDKFNVPPRVTRRGGPAKQIRYVSIQRKLSCPTKCGSPCRVWQSTINQTVGLASATICDLNCSRHFPVPKLPVRRHPSPQAADFAGFSLASLGPVLGEDLTRATPEEPFKRSHTKINVSSND